MEKELRFSVNHNLFAIGVGSFDIICGFIAFGFSFLDFSTESKDFSILKTNDFTKVLKKFPFLPNQDHQDLLQQEKDCPPSIKLLFTCYFMIFGLALGWFAILSGSGILIAIKKKSSKVFMIHLFFSVIYIMDAGMFLIIFSMRYIMFTTWFVECINMEPNWSLNDERIFSLTIIFTFIIGMIIRIFFCVRIKQFHNHFQLKVKVVATPL